MANYRIESDGAVLTARSRREVVELASQIRFRRSPWAWRVPDEEWAAAVIRNRFVVALPSSQVEVPDHVFGFGDSEDEAWDDAFHRVVDRLDYYFGECSWIETQA